MNATNLTGGILDRIEYYSVPFCFLLGMSGNLLGSACILANRRMRKRTPLFILAAMGITDSIMLVAQMQRWFSLNLYNFLAVSYTACKFHFSFVHFSLLASCSLTCILLTLRFVSLYMGTYRLSSYSNLGQALSKLSVAYTLALVSCLSSQDLFKTSREKEHGRILPENLCFKGSKESEYILFHLVDLIYFMLALSLHILLIIMPVFIMTKILTRKNIKPSRNDSQDETLSLRGASLYVKRSHTLNLHPVRTRPSLEQEKRPHHQSLPDLSNRARKKRKDQRTTLSVDRLNLRFIDEVLLNDTTRANKSIRINSGLVQESAKFRSKYFDRKKPEKAEPKDFSMFVVIISLFCSLLSLPYLLLDYFYSNDPFLLEIYSQEQTNLTKTLLQLPLILINIPFSIKFYLLFFFYKKFRIQISRFLRVRFFIDDKFLSKLARRRKLSINSYDKKWSWPAFRFIMIHHSSSFMCCLPFCTRQKSTQPPVCLCLNVSHKATDRPSLSSINVTSIEADRIRVSKMYNKLCREDCFADDTSSIAGFQVFSTNPASSLNNYNTTDVSLLNLFDTSVLPTTSKSIRSVPSSPVKKSLEEPSDPIEAETSKLSQQSNATVVLTPRSPLVF